MALKKMPLASRKNFSERQNESEVNIPRYNKARQGSKKFIDEVAKTSQRRELGLNNKEKKHLKDAGECGSWLWFNNYYTIGRVKLAKANFCKHYLICPLCSIRRATVNTAKAMTKVLQVLKENANTEAYMLTLTVVDGEDLQERLGHLKKSWSKMLQRRRNANKGLCESSLSGCLGGLKSIEVKRGSGSGKWHPHMHQVVIAEKGSLPDTSKKGINRRKTALAQEWASITGDSFIVDCRPLKAGNEHELGKSLAEVFKYALKFADLKFKDKLQAWRDLTGVRLCDSWGCLRGLKMEDARADNVSEFEGLPYIEQAFRWIEAGKGEYKLSRVARVDKDGNKEYHYKDEAWRIGEKYGSNTGAESVTPSHTKTHHHTPVETEKQNRKIS